MVLVNKLGFAEIEYNRKTPTIKVGFSPITLSAKFHNIVNNRKEKVTPVWVIECDDINKYGIRTSEDEMYLSISSDYTHTGVVKVTLVDKEHKYEPCAIELEVYNI